MRAAIYYTPPADSELARIAGEWLGRDAFSGEATRAPDASIDPLVAEPARYGFHATMKAPFRLAEGCDLADLDLQLAAFCRGRAPVAIDRLALARLGSFFALVPGGPVAELQETEAAVVRAFEPFRAPLDPEEIARRDPERLTARQREHLCDYGYPFVLEEFRFHMTLTRRIEGEAEGIERTLAARFASVLDQPFAIDALSLFVEHERGGPFCVHSRHALQTKLPEPIAP